MSVINLMASIARELMAFKKFSALPAAEREQSAIPKHSVNHLVSMGPTFIKLGQILSTRPDFMPPKYIKELEVLHDSVPPFGYDQVCTIIKEQLGGDPKAVFQSFDKEPVAAASLSQVHFATLEDGSEVAVKIQRPGIENKISKDLAVLETLVNLICRLIPRRTKNFNLQAAFKEFKRYTKQELDFTLEGMTLNRFRENFKEWEDIIFPAVYWEYSTKKILTMERVYGMKINEAPDKLSLENRRKLNQRLIEMEMRMFVSDAFFHADLHPGNIFFGIDGSIAVIDVGMFGELTSEQRDRFLLYWLAVSDKDNNRAFDHIIKLLKPTPKAQQDSYKEILCTILDEFHATTVSERSWTKTFMEIMTHAARHGYTVPSELLLEAKALTTAETLALTLVPDFKFAETTRPIITRELAKRAKFKYIRKRFEKTFPEWLIMGETPSASIIPKETEERNKDVWNEVKKVWTEEIDEHPYTAEEVKFGENSVIINENIENVFNFVTRLAQYEYWHPTYTENSKVIHVGGDYMFLTPQVVGSVFRIDEIADGYLVMSNGVVTEFERNKIWKWRAPLSLLPTIHIGTCITFADLGDNRTRVYEYFYYLDNDLMEMFKRPWLVSMQALRSHIGEELTGVKRIIENENYAAEDFEYLWENVTEPTRLASNYLRSAVINPGPRKALDPRV